MTEAEEKKLEVAGKGEERKDTNEEIPAWADALGKRFDSFEKRMDALEKRDRKDSRDEGEDPVENTQGEKRKDSDKEERRPIEAADRKDRKDESAKEEEHKAGEELAKGREKQEREDCSRKDEGDTDKDTDREDRARKDAQAMKENREMKAKIAEMEARLGRLYTEPTIDDRNALAETRSRADGIYQALTGHPASAPMPGEAPIAYRKRMADGLRKYSDRMKDVRVDALTGEAFAVVEDHIYADAQAAIRSDAVIPAGTLRAIVTNDRGRERTEYVGDPSVTWEPFTAGAVRVGKLLRPATH